MQLRAEKTKAAIMKAAEEEFSEYGFYGARIDEIAKKSQVNKALIYTYFQNKEELYKTVFYDVYDRFNLLEQKILLNKELDYKSRIREWVQMEFDFAFENVTYVKMVMWENLNKAKYYKERQMEQSKSRIINGLEEIVAQVNRERGKETVITGRELMTNLYACCFYYFSNMYTMGAVLNKDLFTKKEVNKRASEVADMLVTYLEKG